MTGEGIRSESETSYNYERLISNGKVQVTTKSQPDDHLVLTFHNGPKKIQRPRYHGDGSRGCLKGEDGEPVSLQVLVCVTSCGIIW